MVEFALVSVIALSVFVAVAHALFLYERNVLMGSLSEGVRVAAAQDRTVADGEQRAVTLVRQAVGGRVAGALTIVVPAPETASSQCHRPAPSFVPGFPDLPVRMTASMHKEEQLVPTTEVPAERRHPLPAPLRRAPPPPSPLAVLDQRPAPAWLALVGILGGALWLQGAQRLVPVYAAARDLPSGAVLAAGDLTEAQVNLPAAELRQYLQPATAGAYVGQVLTDSLRKDMLVPATIVAPSPTAADQVEIPIKVEDGDLPEGLRPGDQVQVLAAYTDGQRRGTAQVLLPQAEVVHILRDSTASLGGSDRPLGIQVRMPSERAQPVTAALANARIFIIKLQGSGTSDQPQASAAGGP